MTASPTYINGMPVIVLSAPVEVKAEAPVVIINLDKIQVYGCETLAGTATVTDPLGQGGTGFLTYPDGSTLSLNYTGLGSSFPLRYAVNGQPLTTLTFNAEATSASGLTGVAPPTAVKLIEGGLVITMTPNGVILEPKLQARTPLPNQPVAARTKGITITIKDAVQNPVTGAIVTAIVEKVAGTETFGGHAHGTTNPARPLGTLSAIKDLGTGTYTTTYTSPIYAVKDQIQVNVSFQGCSGEILSQPFISQVGGLFSIAPTVAPDTLVGGTCNHHGPSDAIPAIDLACEATDDNHYLTRASLNKLRKLEQAWRAKYPKSGGLRLNDASLPKGGKFELYTLWGSDWVSHITHRRGIDIDIGTRDTNGVYSVTKKKLELLNEGSEIKLFRDIKDETDKFHMHVYFE